MDNKRQFHNMKFCPFLVSKALSSAKSKTLTRYNSGGICALGQQFKPSICLLFPLGRLIWKKQKAQPDEMIYVLQSTQKCIATQTTKKVRAKDYVADYQERTALLSRYSEVMFAVVNRLKEELKNEEVVDKILTTLLIWIYYVDKPLAEKLEKIRADFEVGD